MALTMKDAIKLCEAFIAKWSEITLATIARDIEHLDEKEFLEQAFLRAYWSKLMDNLMAAGQSLEKYKSDRGKLELIAQTFGSELGLPAAEIVPDVAARLDWITNRVAKGFENDVKSLIDWHEIRSPIEQIFLMMWKFRKIEEEHGLQLAPQKSVRTRTGDYRVDFLITAKQSTTLRLAVELDGHDFHERTKEQVRRDKARERAIVAEEYTILRFSGSEVAQNPSKCIDEITELATRQLSKVGRNNKD